jgi:hypothetical protein
VHIHTNACTHRLHITVQLPFILKLVFCCYFQNKNINFAWIFSGLSAVVHKLSPQNKMWISSFNQPPCLWFVTTIISLKDGHAFNIYQHKKFHGYTLTGSSFCIHLRSLNIHHFGMIETTGLRACRWGHLQWHDLPTEAHKYLLLGSAVIWGDTHTHTHTCTDRMLTS